MAGKMTKLNNRGQITIFVIVAILLVSAIILIFILYQNQIEITERSEKDSEGEFSDCINSYVSEAVESIFENAGFIEKPALTYLVRNPKNYYFQDEVKEIPYLCYTGLNYARCNPINPLMINYLEDEIKQYIEPKVEICFESLKRELQDKAYNIRLGNTESFDIEIKDGFIEINIIKKLTREKAGEEEIFEQFSSKFNTNLYKIAKVSEEIISQEIALCNSDYLSIMEGNNRINIKKFQTGDNVKIYTVKDMVTKKEWKFAIRNCVLSTPS